MLRRAAMTAMVFLVACSGPSSTTPTAVPNTPPSPEVTNPSASATATPAAGTTGSTAASTAPVIAPPAADLLRVGVSPPQTLDPTLASDPGAAAVVGQLFTPLLVTDPKTLEPVPGAAITWTVTPDQTVFTFGLRPTARFHSGRLVTGADVKFTLERVLRNGSPAAPPLEVIAGARDFTTRRELTGVAGVEVPHPQLVRITLSEPFAEFPAVLTNPALSPLPKEAVEGTSTPFSVNPVGNGPFRMSRQWDQRGPIELQAVTDSALPATGVSRLRFEPFGDLSRGLLAFRRNELDVVSVPPAVLGSVEDDEEHLRTTPFLGSYFFAFNLREPNLAKPEFRKAILAALDRPAIVTGVLRDSLTVRHGPVPAAFPGWPANACGDLCARNEGNARALLAAAFPDGQIPPVNIDVDSDPTQVAVATAMKDQLRSVGIPAEVRAKPFQEYRDFLTGAVGGEPGLFRSGWVTGSPTPDQFITPLFATGRPDNLTGYTNSELDTLLEETRKERDPRKRVDNYRLAEEKILSDAPIVPLAALQSHWVVGDAIEGLDVGPLGGFEARTVSVKR